MRTRSGKSQWSIPYPQEVNDIPMIIGRQMDRKDFAQLFVDNFEERLEQARTERLVMDIALHPYLVGQPYRLRYLRRALSRIATARDRNDIWWATPGEICSYVNALNVLRTPSTE